MKRSASLRWCKYTNNILNRKRSSKKIAAHITADCWHYEYKSKVIVIHRCGLLLQ